MWIVSLPVLTRLQVEAINSNPSPLYCRLTESHHCSNMPCVWSILIQTCEAGVTIIRILPFKEQRPTEDKEQAQCWN